MITKNSPHVRNPLTIIAIFAGIAEVSGTAVVAFLEQGQQSTFVWFLVIFPNLLILLFFATLNFNPKVLYAPSDFESDENFLKVHKYDLSTQQSFTETVVLDSTEIAERSSDRSVSITDVPFCTVLVSNFKNAQNFVGLLVKDGYTASVYESGKDTSSIDDHQSIWIGNKVNPKEVLQIIRKSIEFYPHLKYMHISGDGGAQPPKRIHTQMYIGGATSTAKDYKIRPFSQQDIDSIPEDITRDDLHKFIRSYY